MKEERKEKSHRECNLELRSTLLPEAGSTDCLQYPVPQALCEQGGRGGLPEGLVSASLRNVPRTRHPCLWQGRATKR